MTASEHMARCQAMRGGVTKSEATIIADLAACEKERDRQKDAAESWKDSYRECLARAEAAEVGGSR